MFEETKINEKEGWPKKTPDTKITVSAIVHGDYHIGGRLNIGSN